MASDLITGYTDTFKAFVNFANRADETGNRKAIARVDDSAGLAGRKITAATTDVVRSFFKFRWFRSSGDKSANNTTRKLFMDAVVKMYGSEAKIPPSVKKAMILSDYDKGKPLTARRIIAVKVAIDQANALPKQHAFLDSISQFKSPETANAALSKGYAKGELTKLAYATNLYSMVMQCSETEAFNEVTKIGSKANRLMNYGGRFLHSEENFKAGLRLIDSFGDWFGKLCDVKRADSGKFNCTNSFTEINFNGASFVRNDRSCLAGFERLIFEDLAVNDSLDLNETDPEKIFGMKNNAAMRFYGTKQYENKLSTIAAIPPEKRKVVFAVFDKLMKPMPETNEDARKYYKLQARDREVNDSGIIIARILRHMPQIEKLMANEGTFTEKNIIKTLCPDIPSRTWTLKAMNEYTNNVRDIAEEEFMDKGIDEEVADAKSRDVRGIIEETGCTYKEAMSAHKTGRRPAPPKYMSSVALSVFDLEGTDSGVSLLAAEGSGDLLRPCNYAPVNDNTNFYIKSDENVAFGFTFPGKAPIKVNQGVHKGNIPDVIDSLKKFAGDVHPRQQSALMFAVSQSGLSPIKDGLEPFGIIGSEHGSVNFSFSKDPDTGAITITYSSPEELPVNFSWTATIDVDGNASSTPLVVAMKN